MDDTELVSGAELLVASVAGSGTDLSAVHVGPLDQHIHSGIGVGNPLSDEVWSRRVCEGRKCRGSEVSADHYFP